MNKRTEYEKKQDEILEQMICEMNIRDWGREASKCIRTVDELK